MVLTLQYTCMVLDKVGHILRLTPIISWSPLRWPQSLAHEVYKSYLQHMLIHQTSVAFNRKSLILFTYTHNYLK